MAFDQIFCHILSEISSGIVFGSGEAQRALVASREGEEEEEGGREGGRKGSEGRPS